MTTTRLKRIEELEGQVNELTHALEQKEMREYLLVHHLQEISKGRGTDPVDYARWALEDTNFVAQLQQRDLNIAYRTISQLNFPVNVRKQWSGDEVQTWVDQYAEVLKQRALAHGADKVDKKETIQ